MSWLILPDPLFILPEISGGLVTFGISVVSLELLMRRITLCFMKYIFLWNTHLIILTWQQLTDFLQSNGTSVCEVLLIEISQTPWTANIEDQIVDDWGKAMSPFYFQMSTIFHALIMQIHDSAWQEHLLRKITYVSCKILLGKFFATAGYHICCVKE